VVVFHKFNSTDANWSIILNTINIL
jgi:hypothetical protein